LVTHYFAMVALVRHEDQLLRESSARVDEGIESLRQIRTG
jgi:hypothetical protein